MNKLNPDILNPNFAIDLQNLHACLSGRQVVPPLAGLTPPAPKRCVAARWADSANAKSGLKELVTMRMPFGKYEGRILCDLPEPYLVWYHRKGFPEGTLGVLLATLYEIKLNGLEHLLEPLRSSL